MFFARILFFSQADFKITTLNPPLLFLFQPCGHPILQNITFFKRFQVIFLENKSTKWSGLFFQSWKIFPNYNKWFQVFQLSSPPKPSPESYTTVPKILSDIYKSQQGELDEDHRDYFWIEDHLSEKTNIIKHHPMSHNYESSSFGNTAHHLKFDFNLKDHEQHHRTELFLHTEQMANNSLINLYKVWFIIIYES